MRNGSFLLTCIAVLAGSIVLHAESKQRAYEAARRHALDATDIFSSGPVQIRSTFHLHLVGGQVEGTYLFSRASKEDFREDVHLQDFNESVVSRSGERYVLRSKDLEPLAVSYLRDLIHLPHVVPIDAPASKISTSVLNGQNVECYTVDRHYSVFAGFSDYTDCFDPVSGALTAVEWSFNSETHRFEYLGFVHIGSKLFPSILRRFHNGSLLLEANVDSISNAGIDANFFDPPKNSLKQSACERFEPARPEYGEKYFRIRSEYDSGAVVVAGSLDDHGKVQETEVQQSGGSKLDSAALDAVKEVHIHPAKCDGHATPSLFRLEVWFSPALHPDSFQSFR